MNNFIRRQMDDIKSQMDSRWVWGNAIGSIQAMVGNPDVIVVDTYVDMTTGKDEAVSYQDNQDTAKKKCTDQGYDLWARFRSHDDVPSVAVTTRQFGIMKYPLVSREIIVDFVKKTLERAAETIPAVKDEAD